MKGLLKRAAVLCRVSTEDQAEGTSLDTQAEICMEEAKRRGYHVTEEDIFKEDGYSGALGIDARSAPSALGEISRGENMTLSSSTVKIGFPALLPFLPPCGTKPEK